MLYKKYHRNFVKQFKVGVKFRWDTRKLSVDTVKIEPYVVDITGYYEVRMNGNKYGWVLVYSRGMIERSIKVI